MNEQSQSSARRRAGDFYYQQCLPILRWARRAATINYAKLWRTRRQRVLTEKLLVELARGRRPQFSGRVLVDGMWDNPHYWLRYSLFRAALGTAECDEVGLLGRSAAKRSAATFRRLGVRCIVQLDDFLPPIEAVLPEARALLERTSTPEDILAWKLPFDFPAGYVYDGILKRQRRATVDLKHGRLQHYVVDALRYLLAADRLLREGDFKLVLLSHAIDYTYGALAWRATQLNIPSVVLYGWYSGSCRFWKPRSCQDIYTQRDRPTAVDFAAASPGQLQALSEIGRVYLSRRREGGADDFSGSLTYQKSLKQLSRQEIINFFGWDANKPLIAVYSASWFDFPKSVGMFNFRDCLDWIMCTLDQATANHDVNWLFKSHPAEDWYGGLRLADVMPKKRPPHIGLAPRDWNNAAVLQGADAFITYSGTIGVEAAAIGKPVLVPDEGWYHDSGFVKWAKSRDEYLNALGQSWWTDFDSEKASFHAQSFAGWYFGYPAWQGDFFVKDDTLQQALYDVLPDTLTKCRSEIEREIAEIGDWFRSGHPHYHVFKMGRAEDYKVPTAV